MKCLIPAALLLCFAVAASADDAYRQGRHFDAISPAVDTAVEGDRIEIVEMFWYGCPHCYQFEPVIDGWLEHKADNIEFVRVPAVFARNWETHARAYYAAEQLGVLGQSHKALFDALHRDRKRLFTEDALAEFFTRFGVSADDFRAAYNSFDVDKKTRRAISLTRRYGIGGVPAIIVNGKYRASTTQTDGSYEELLKVADFLAAKESGR